MSCCGSNRQNWPADTPAAQAISPVKQATDTNTVRFRYRGSQSLSVTGGITGKTYHFANPGAEILIDLLDVPGMYAVPNVELLRY